MTQSVRSLRKIPVALWSIPTKFGRVRLQFYLNEICSEDQWRTLFSRGRQISHHRGMVLQQHFNIGHLDEKDIRYRVPVGTC